MSIQSAPYPSYFSDHWKYSLQAQYAQKKSTLIMHAPHTLLSTSALPKTAEILSTIAPKVLHTKCFNKKNIPFCEEVKNTEIAHLFEHMLLEYLCQEKINSGKKSACFSGLTSWNWKKDAHGVFHIKITGNVMNETTFIQAFARSIFLFETILARHSKIITPKQIDLDYLFVKRMHE
ncbi:MAG TPA: hypothetical protein PLD54_02380 [Candidatus Levybacteria bacterium]|nr:hypothetical protein [Candidatus Levybacteria bacterium]